jgi:uncharacterized protein YciI
MQFLVLGYDGADAGAKDRRHAARSSHISHGSKMVERGEALFGVALQDGTGDMNGSAYIVDFPDRAALDAWLAEEPYVTGKVWQKIEVIPCKVGPSFEHIVSKKS